MRETFKTAPLFAAILPAMPDTAHAVRWHYADIADMNIPADRPASAWLGSAWNGDDNDKRGTSTMRDAMTLAREGWKAGADQAHKLRDGIEAATPHMPRLTRYDVAGSVPSVARAIAGNPMNMRRMQVAESRRMPTITLLCDTSVSWNFPGEAMLKHATAIAAVADILEGAGYRCEILAVERTGDGSMTLESVIRAKAPEDTANLSKLVFTLGHASVLRRLMFASWQMDSDAAELGVGHGSPRPFKAVPESGVFVTPTGESLGTYATPIQRFIATCNALRAQGCPGIPDAADMPKA